MSFTKTRDNLAKQSVPSGSLAEFQLQYLNADHRQNIEAIRDKCAYHLFEDVAKLKTKHNFESYLGHSFYRSSNEYAVDCTEIAFYSEHIFGKKIKHWTDSALKCFDNFLLRYINVVLQEKITKSSKELKERDVYTHLILKGGVNYEVGIAFESIYQARNEFTHVQVEEADGVRKPIQWSNKMYNKKRELILAQFKKGLENLELILSIEGVGAEA